MSALLACLTAALATAAPGENLLKNGGFDDSPSSGSVAPGWSTQGDAFGHGRLVGSPTASGPRALELSPQGKGSSGNDSFMVFQVLPVAELRGKRISFGARVQTEGAAVNLVLFTPERSANDFDANVHTSELRARTGVLEVPPNASLLSFGIQVFGKPGTRAVVDDAFVRLDAPGQGQAPPSGAGAPAGKVRVRVEPAKVERRLDPWLFCMHLEWVENGMGLLERNRDVLREEVMAKLRPLHIPLFRFPGGIHADYYDWQLGVKPWDKRGEGENAFTGKRERERFGTPELAALLKATGGAALITANYGTGSAEQAGAWAHYLAQEHVPAPLWEVGNEIYLSGPKTNAPNGSRIFHPGEKYARDFPAYRAAILKEMPNAKVGAIAHLDTGAFALAPGENRDWTKQMLSQLRSPVDFVSVHDAYAPVILNDANDFQTEDKRRAAYRSLYAAADQTRENLDEVASLVDRLSPQNKGVKVAVTEFGPLFGVTQKPKMQSVYVDQSRTQAAAIYVASLMDVFIGHPRVMAACYTNPIHRWYGSLLTDTDHGPVMTPTYHLYALYRSRFFQALVKSDVTSPTFDAGPLGLVKRRQGVPDVVAKATRSDDRKRVGLMVVNRSVDQEHEVEVVLKGTRLASADCQVLAAGSPWASNGPKLTETTTTGDPIAPRPLGCKADGTLHFRLAPNAVASVVVKVR